VRELKYIGELEYNFENMLHTISSKRTHQYTEQLLTQIDNVINQEPQLYQKQELTKKILFQELNRLKERCKLEVDSRQRADEEIQSALEKYEELIMREVETKRQEIKTAKK